MVLLAMKARKSCGYFRHFSDGRPARSLISVALSRASAQNSLQIVRICSLAFGLRVQPRQTMKTPPSIHLLRPSFAALLAAIAALATGLAAQAQNYPVTPQQRATAQQAAQAGVPLSELAPDAPDEYTIKRGDTLWAISRLYLRSPWRFGMPCLASWFIYLRFSIFC